MSGHSKWSTIKHQKGATDKKRGQAFSRITKIITLAVKQGGGGDPDSNFRLRMAIDKAKEINMPKDNIQRAIQRGTGGGEEGEFNEYWYEGFGPHQTVFMIHCVTDNANRCLSEVKGFLDKRGLTMGTPGSVAYLFEKKGQIILAKSFEPEQDQLRLMDLNPDEILEKGDNFVVLMPFEKLQSMLEQTRQGGFTIKDSNIIYYPKNLLSLNDKQKEDVIAFLQELRELEDVDSVFINTDL